MASSGGQQEGICQTVAKERCKELSERKATVSWVKDTLMGSGKFDIAAEVCELDE